MFIFLLQFLSKVEINLFQYTYVYKYTFYFKYIGNNFNLHTYEYCPNLRGKVQKLCLNYKYIN